MATDNSGSSPTNEKLIFALQNDLKTLSLETKKKHGFVKDACEEAIAKIRGAQASPNCMAYITNQALYPVIQGCDTKDPKIVKLCLHSIQKLITGGYVDVKGARSIYETVVVLLENGIEEIKVLQIVTLLLTTNNIVKGDILAKCLVLCFRLHCSKDITTAHAAGATVRQLVSLVFERIDKDSPVTDVELSPEATDAYSLFQDLIFLVNGEKPVWLVGISEMFRSFGLELLETVLYRFPFVFVKYDKFGLLLKERVCAMVIKLFSPNAKFKATQAQQGQTAAGDLLLDKPFYPTSVRLLRIVDILINKYYTLLVTECEIFLSLLVRFLDPDKPTWQRCLALEVLHKLITSPQHLSKFCRSYDLKPHATNICKDMVNALGAYVQSVFANPIGAMAVSLSTPTTGNAPNSNVTTNPANGPTSCANDASTIGFYFRGSLVPLVQVYQPSTPKPQLMELTDKQEPPNFATSESYGVAISFACLSDFVLSLVHIDKEIQDGQQEEAEVLKQLLSSSWPGLLAALNLLLEASIDDSITESICERLVDLATLSGKCSLQQCREATVLSLCVATLPPHYGYAVLKGTIGHGESPHPISYSEMDNGKQQVVHVGTSVVPSLALPPSLQSTPVMLTKKNLLVTHSVLRLCLESGAILLTSWLTVLTTLQHLCWVCACRAVATIVKLPVLNSTTSGFSTGVSELSVTSSSEKLASRKSFKSTNGAVGSSGGVMGVVVDFVSCLSQGVMRLIETSVALDDVSLHHVINALTNLSQEAMEIAYSNREPSLFAVAKLLEIGLVNLDRVEIYWRPLTNHLLEVCRHPHIRMREWGSEAITYLVRSALLHEDTEDEKVHQLLLSPLCELSSIPHNDVRNKQLMALSQILHCKGDKLKSSWPLAINILGDIYDNHSEGLVRTAFQCLQLVVTDYLPVLPCGCIPHAIDTVAKFARQKQELNVALSAIGLTWNIADFLYQNRARILENLTPDISVFPDFPGVSEIPQFDRLWLGIYQRLGELCIDERPAVRKSSGQTLFSTISAHSAILNRFSWDSVMWQVLFPLLEAVETSWKNASCLVLSGIAKIFSVKRQSLLEIKDFPKAWFFFLQFMQNGAMSNNEEVSLAALKSFQESLVAPQDFVGKEPEEMWTRSWLVYCDIGRKVICDHGAHQHFLTAYVTIFQYLFPALKLKLTLEDISAVNKVFSKSLLVPLTAEGASSIIFSSSENGITPLQDQIYNAYDILINETDGSPQLKVLLPPVIVQLIDFGAHAVRHSANVKVIPLEGVVPNCMEFGVKCLKRSLSVLERICTEKFILESDMFCHCLKSFRPILSSRFQNAEGSWRECASQFFLAVPLMVERKPKSPEFWDELAKCAQDFLFFTGNGEWMTKKAWKDEKMDVRMVTLLKELVFTNDGFLPAPFLIEVVKIFHRGSCINEYDGINVSEREEFVRFCFSSLLEFVLKGPSNVSEIVEMQSGDDGKKIAVLALLQRFQNILLNYKDYVNHNSHIPIQRHRLAEMNFVLRAIASLIENLKAADPTRVAGGTWEHIIGIYPDLVAIVGLPGVDTSISVALRDALMAYRDLLQRPPEAKFKN
ncbi:Protein MON2 [Orchesella cincta]|uniref:Protein MON2 homolog n=1 Tax=Orchesella cincta TaxID=48709 RepID=A0A1D2N8T9_ORCCI|nr:Protein MON2 [Orchesella cincta]